MGHPSQRPLIDIFIGRDCSAWRLYFASSSWKPANIGSAGGGSVEPPEFAALDRFIERSICLAADVVEEAPV